MNICTPNGNYIWERIVANEARFWERVIRSDDCWLWEGKVDNGGYGRFGLRLGPKQWKTNYLAHRYSYELVYGPVPKGLEVHHKCRIRNCVNPAHLQAVTHKENCQSQNRGKLISNAV